MDKAMILDLTFSLKNKSTLEDIALNLQSSCALMLCVKDGTEIIIVKSIRSDLILERTKLTSYTKYETRYYRSKSGTSYTFFVEDKSKKERMKVRDDINNIRRSKDPGRPCGTMTGLVVEIKSVETAQKTVDRVVNIPRKKETEPDKNKSPDSS